MDPTRLLFPALRWQDEGGFDHEAERIAAALRGGVAGFILFGGDAASVRRLTEDLRARAPHPLLFGADLERGAGQQFTGCTPLPPAAALGALGDLEVCWKAGNVTAREARALGIGWVYAPVADLDNEPRNPIVGTRSFGADPDHVARAVAAWIQGCRDGGALACAKHFPGHGRSRTDSHVDLPVVEARSDALAQDLVPFVAAVEAGVPSVMTAHVAYPALDPSGVPATRSGPVVQGLLRRRLGFDGLVVTDALVMEGAAAGSSGELAAAFEALDAGVDALLYPRNPATLAEGLAKAVAAGRVSPRGVLRSVERIERAATEVAGAVGSWGREEDIAWARETAVRSLTWLRGRPPGPHRKEATLVVVDDDSGGPYPPPSREPLTRALAAHGVREGPPGGTARTWLAIFCDPRGWKARAGLSEASHGAVAEVAPTAELVLLFGHPRLAAEVPGNAPVLCAWGGERIMQEAAAEATARGSGPS